MCEIDASECPNRETRAETREIGLQISYRSDVQETRIPKTCDVTLVHSPPVLPTNPPVFTHFHSQVFQLPCSVFDLISFLFSHTTHTKFYDTSRLSSRVKSPHIPANRSNPQLSYDCRVRHVELAAIRSRLRCSSRCHPQVATFQGRALRNASSCAKSTCPRRPRIRTTRSMHSLSSDFNDRGQ